MESSLTALLGRLDAFRLITVYNVQSDSSYMLGKRSNIAIDWSRDIITQSATTNMYHFENKIDKYERALLGDYYGDIAWQPAFNALFDTLATNNVSSNWLSQIKQYSESQNFHRIKSLAQTTFSTLSKGVHSEFLIDINTTLDNETLKSTMKDVFHISATLGLLSHFIGFMNSRIEIDNALNYYIAVEEMISNE